MPGDNWFGGKIYELAIPGQERITTCYSRRERDQLLRKHGLVLNGKSIEKAKVNRPVTIHQVSHAAQQRETPVVDFPVNQSTPHLNVAGADAVSGHDPDNISTADTAFSADVELKTEAMGDNRTTSRRSATPAVNQTPHPYMPTLFDAAKLLSSQGVTVRLGCNPTNHTLRNLIDDQQLLTQPREAQAMYVVLEAGGQLEFIASAPPPIIKCQRCPQTFASTNDVSRHMERYSYCEIHKVCFAEEEWADHLDDYVHDRCPWPGCEHREEMKGNQIHRHFGAYHRRAQMANDAYGGA